MARTVQTTGAHSGTDGLRVRSIDAADLKEVLAKGLDDFLAMPTFAVFIVVIYPIIGLALLMIVFGYNLLSLIFPLAAGFPLIGPLAAIGLYELSRRRERGLDASLVSLASIPASRLRALFAFGFLLMALLAVWLAAAALIYQMTLGDWGPGSADELFNRVLATPEGWRLIIIGCGVGFVLAVIAFTISVVSGPLLIDREVDVGTAVQTSFNAVMASPGPMALWAAILAGSLLVGSLPFFIGLAVVLPILGHATWHLYRRVVPD